MPEEIRHIDIPMARITLLRGGLVEVNIHPDQRIDVVGIQASMKARRELLGGGSGPLFFIAVGDLDWEMAALQTDLFGEDSASITAMAVQVSNKVLALAANMYFGLFPADFPTRISSDEAELRTWLSAN